MGEAKPYYINRSYTNEKWEVVSDVAVRWRLEEPRILATGVPEKEAEEWVACVNALEGVEDPAAYVGALEAFVKVAIERDGGVHDTFCRRSPVRLCTCVHDSFIDALARAEAAKGKKGKT